MSTYDLIFYLFAAITLLSGFVVVTSKNIIYSAFSLLFTFFGVTGIYALLGADFIAIVQLVVYVGGILILLIFGVMLTNKVTNVDLKTGGVNVLPAAIGTGLFAGALTAIMSKNYWRAGNITYEETSIYTLGSKLLLEYSLIFELLAILLLVALVGAAVIARRGRES